MGYLCGAAARLAGQVYGANLGERRPIREQYVYRPGPATRLECDPYCVRQPGRTDRREGQQSPSLHNGGGESRTQRADVFRREDDCLPHVGPDYRDHQYLYYGRAKLEGSGAVRPLDVGRGYRRMYKRDRLQSPYRDQHQWRLAELERRLLQQQLTL